MTMRPNVLLAPRTVTVEVGLEPVFNPLNSLALISFPDANYGVDPWVQRTAKRLTDDQAQRSRVLIGGLYGIVTMFAERGWSDFPAYLEGLASQEPFALRDELMAQSQKRVAMAPGVRRAGINVPPIDMLLRDRERYLEFITEVAEFEGHEKFLISELNEEGHRLLNDPPALQGLMFDHLSEMWDQVLGPEWERTLPMLTESVEAFRQLDFRELTAYEAIRAITSRDMRGMVDDELTGVEHIIFAPSPHVGPYISPYPADRLIRILFPVRMPEGVRPRAPEITRSELLVRLSALADDSRLRILELLTHHDELCAQDVITMLALSQSAASRHLRQLTATGYLIERRLEGNKCYRKNPERIEEILRSISTFLLGR